MSNESTKPGPDLSQGIPLDQLADGTMLAGHVGGEDVLLVRRGERIFAIGAQCTHYHGPLVDGLLVGDTVRCPWHHACFDLHTGEALAAPAFSPVASWEVEPRNGKIWLGEKRAQPPPKRRDSSAGRGPENVVIVGGGAAGFAAAEMLRWQGYQNSVVMLSSDGTLPYDRPNLSKDYLAGSAPFDYLPLRDESFYGENHIETRLGQTAVGVDVGAREVVLAGGDRVRYDRLLLATGAEPVRLPIPGADQSHVRTLRSLADCHAIIECASGARRAAVVGASFIGLEVAAALRARGLAVDVVAPEHRPMERILGPQMGDFIRALHEEHGVVFHLGDTVSAIDGKRLKLKGGDTLEADLVVVGIGVRPRLELAAKAGLDCDRGVTVDQCLQTSAPGIYAAGDIARWPDPRSGQTIRVEHWVVAECQGQAAALNMLGLAEPFTAVPFFWSQHYDVPINYVGHAESWEEIAVDGDIPGKNCLLRFKRNGRVLAIASIFRDLENLQGEVAMERPAA